MRESINTPKEFNIFRRDQIPNCIILKLFINPFSLLIEPIKNSSVVFFQADSAWVKSYNPKIMRPYALKLLLLTPARFF